MSTAHSSPFQQQGTTEVIIAGKPAMFLESQLQYLDFSAAAAAQEWAKKLSGRHWLLLILDVIGLCAVTTSLDCAL